jgi:hypothetical protein
MRTRSHFSAMTMQSNWGAHAPSRAVAGAPADH